MLALSKYSGYCVLLSAFIFLPVILWLHKKQIKSQLKFLLILICTVILLTGWWFVRNYYQFAGDITGTQTMNNIWVLTYHHQLKVFNTPWPIIFSTSFWRILFFSFWGWFGYMTHSLPRIIYYGYLAFVLIAGWRAAAMVWARRTDSQSLKVWTWLLFSTCFIANLGICILGCCSGIAGPQGRYLFPSEVPIMAMLIAGLASNQDKWSKILIISLLVFNLFVYCYSTYFFCH